MSWVDRQREAALTTPDGTRFVFLFEDLERSRAENASIFRFAEKSGAFIQRLSSGEDIYPITAIFSGADYDLIGADFWEKTKDPGVFLLEHPRFSGLKRVQLLSIRQRVAAKTADNQTIFDLVLHETLLIVQPSTVEDITSQILNTASDLNSESAAQYGDNTDFDNALAVVSAQGDANNFVDDMNDFFKDIAAKEAAINTAFDAQFLSVKSTIDNVNEEPLEFASNLTVFVSTPSRVAVNINDRINNYIGLLDNTIERYSYTSQELLAAVKNQGTLAALTSFSILSAMCQASVSDASYNARADVLLVADNITDSHDRVIDMIDEYLDELGNEEDPADRRLELSEAMNTLNDLVSLTISRLFEIAFTLRQERFITLEREYATVELTHKLYGYSDVNLDFLIETNQIKGDEIYLLPQNKEVVYYI